MRLQLAPNFSAYCYPGPELQTLPHRALINL